MLADPELDTGGALRISVSAGEALPADVGRRWKERTGVDILDGIGSTEMLHIFLSNRPGEAAMARQARPSPATRSGSSTTTGLRWARGRLAIFG